MAVIGAVILTAGIIALGQLTYWFIPQSSWTRDGNDLRDQSRAILPFLVAAVVVALGVTVIVRRRRVVGLARGIGLAIIAIVAVAGAVFAVQGYPQVERAHLVAIDPDTHTLLWRTELPLSTVAPSVGDQTADRIRVEGSRLDHSCGFTYSSVYLDPATGRILDVDEDPPSARPSTYPSAPEVPTAIDHNRYVVESASQPFICQR